MPSNQNVHRRRSVRLTGFDYASPGAYFVTIVTHGRECVFGDVVSGAMRLNDLGRIANDCWAALPIHFPMVELDQFVIMPNHVHGIVGIRPIGRGVACYAPTTRRTFRSPYAGTLSTIVRPYKSATARMIGVRLWQRNYHEHVICSESALNRIRQYIIGNPANWEKDEGRP